MVEHRFEKKDLIDISNWWQERLRESVRLLPSDWINAVLPEAVIILPVPVGRSRSIQVVRRRCSRYLP